MNVYIGSNSRLPSGYQEVEYIGLSGTQRIEGLRLPVDFKFTINASFDTTSTYYNIYDTTEVSPMLWVDSSGRLEMNINYTSNVFTKNQFIEVISDATGSNNIVKIDGTQVISGTKIKSIKKDTTLLHRGSNDGFKGKISSIVIEDGTTKIRDLIPCYHKSDGEIGMYDLVNDQFYTNSGTGTFTKGSDVYTNVLQNAYIGEYKGYEYSYDFRNKSSSQLSADGRSVLSGRLETSAYGITAPVGYDVYVCKSGLDLSNANKITITFTSVWNRNDNDGRYILFGLSDTTSTFQNTTQLILSSGYTTSKVCVTTSGTTTYGTDIGNIGQSTYTSTFEIDLVNKTLTGKVPGLGVSTLSLTDAQITSIRGLTRLRMYTTQHTFYLQDVSVTVE